MDRVRKRIVESSLSDLKGKIFRNPCEYRSIEHALEQFEDGLYNSLMRSWRQGATKDGGDWLEFPDTLRSGDRICCGIDGTTVSAIVNFSDKDLSVVIESPKAGLRGGSHIMFTAPYTFRNSDVTGSCHAVKSARKLLPELWNGYLRLLALTPSVSNGLKGGLPPSWTG